MIAIIDYGVGNLFSLKSSLAMIGADAVVSGDADVIRNADWVIDLGPDAGDAGGEVVFEGTPEDLVKEGKTFTAKYLKEQWMQ